QSVQVVQELAIDSAAPRQSRRERLSVEPGGVNHGEISEKVLVLGHRTCLGSTVAWAAQPSDLPKSRSPGPRFWQACQMAAYVISEIEVLDERRLLFVEGLATD